MIQIRVVEIQIDSKTKFYAEYQHSGWDHWEYIHKVFGTEQEAQDALYWYVDIMNKSPLGKQ